MLSSLQKLQPSKNSCRKLNQEERNQVILPPTHNSQVIFDIAPLAVVGKVQLQHSREPILRRPRIEGIFVVASRRGNLHIDRLSLVRIRDGKDISKGSDSEHQAQDENDEPDAVKQGRESRSEYAGPASKPKSDDTPKANQDDCRSRRAVAGMALVDEEVLRFAVEIECRAVEVDGKGAAGGVVKPCHHAGDEGQLKNGIDHQHAQGDAESGKVRHL